MKLLFIILIITSCGEPASPKVVADFSGEQVELVFARETEDGQYCFYANRVDKKLLPPTCSEEDLKNLARYRKTMAKKDQKTRNEAQQLYQQLTNKLKVDFTKISEGSRLLTERSVSSRALQYPLISNTRWSNIASKISYPPYAYLFTLACLVGVFTLPLSKIPLAVKGFSCLPFFVSSIASFGAQIVAGSEGRRQSQASLSPYIHRDPSLVSELRKIFQWLESANSVECPKQPKIIP